MRKKLVDEDVMNYAYLAKITLTDLFRINDLKAYTFKAWRCIRQTRFKFFGLDRNVVFKLRSRFKLPLISH